MLREGHWVDGVGAYSVYARKTDSVTRYTNWKMSHLNRGGAYTLSLGTLTSGERVDTTLTWLRHVGFDKKTGNYYQSATLEIPPQRIFQQSGGIYHGQPLNRSMRTP